MGEQRLPEVRESDILQREALIIDLQVTEAEPQGRQQRRQEQEAEAREPGKNKVQAVISVFCSRDSFLSFIIAAHLLPGNSVRLWLLRPQSPVHGYNSL